MLKKILVGVMIVLVSICFSGIGFAGDKEILGVTFPGEKVIAGKTLKLNGVAYRKAFGIVKVFVSGLYLEKPTHDAKEAIESEQVKYLMTHYLTNKATAKKLRDGFIKEIEKCNPPDMVQTHQADIEKYASWLDKDMAPGLISASTYIPGKGLTLEYQGELRGTISGSAFAQMYYRYNFGKKAKKNIRKGLLGL